MERTPLLTIVREEQQSKRRANLLRNALLITSLTLLFVIAISKNAISSHIHSILFTTPSSPTSSSTGTKGGFEVMRGAWSSRAEPFSIISPFDLGVVGIDRPQSTRPGPIFAKLKDANKNLPLPTNSWLENFFLGTTNSGPHNRVFQVPYIIDTNGFIQGVRAHPAHVQANARQVEMTFEDRNGLTLGAVESFSPQHQLHHDNTRPHGIARLSAVLEWSRAPSILKPDEPVPIMRAPVVRGAPYVTMEYFNSTPRIYVQRGMAANPIVDSASSMVCGTRLGEFGPPTLVTDEIMLHFDTADTTWLVFVSEPMEFVCSNVPVNKTLVSVPGTVVHMPGSEPGWQLRAASFELRALAPVSHAMIRTAMVNNCTVGQNPITCPRLGVLRDQSEYTQLIRKHKDIYPSGDCDIEFVFPVQSTVEEELRLQFNWRAASMKQLKNTGISEGPEDLEEELIMFALPHHQERVREIPGSSNKVLETGCVWTINGKACLISGGVWSLLEHLHRIGFNAPRPPRKEMLKDIRAAVDKDLEFQIPENYRIGAGDTYFSGKILSKFARILTVAEDVGHYNKAKFNAALERLKEGIEVWLTGDALSPLLFDHNWGGMVSCGCLYNETSHKCNNRYPNCPALTDPGSNFGAGFYNDHHFHYGYHIYAAAVAAHFDHAWGRKFYQHVLLLVRDIANPSADDPFFPTWRHKDWYLGSSWASGIGCYLDGEPYANGRNQESSSESISAYEGVAMFGDSMVNIFQGSSDPYDQAELQTALV